MVGQPYSLSLTSSGGTAPKDWFEYRAAPSYAHGYSVRDDAAYAAWDGISRDRATFRQWMQEHVTGVVPSTA